MSRSKRRSRQRATLIGGMIGAIIILSFVISLAAPDLGSRSRNDDSVTIPTYTPYGTLPPPTPIIIPTPDPNPQLEGNLPYIHSSGYFQTFWPAGSDWSITEQVGTDTSTTYAHVAIQSGPRLAVIYNFVQPGVEFESVENYSETQMTANYLAGSWADYESWTETGRTLTDDSVIIDLDLVSHDNSYLARTINRLGDGAVYVTRLVVPANNPDLLDLLQELVVPVFVGYNDLQQLPQVWPTHIDREQGYVIKHPSYWRILAGEVGRPVTYGSTTDQLNMRQRIWVTPDQMLETAEDAGAWLAENEPTATVVEVAAVTREVGTGFQVAYTYRDDAGDEHSGLAVLLNDDAGALFAANLQLDPAGLNLLDADADLTPLEGEARQAVAEGFVLLPDAARQGMGE